ncbi:MAG: SDR family NAD(P)-dependent oxidoreductase [Acidimicrobiia bacterium]
MADRLAGKVAVITGGASGIGAACARRFAAEGADIVIADLDAERAAPTVADVEAAGRRARFVRTDTSLEADNVAMADAAMEAFGRLDCLVAAAGIANADYVSGQDSTATSARDVLRQPLADWERVLAVNLTGVMLSDRAIAARMIEAGNGGAIVNIASSAAAIPLRGGADYCVSKAGVWMLTKVLALELVGHGIRVNAIGPGFIETPMTTVMRTDPAGEAMMKRMTPMRRLGQPEEIASTALFLVSEDSSYLTGQLLFPNGGMFVG